MYSTCPYCSTMNKVDGIKDSMYVSTLCCTHCKLTYPLWSVAKETIQPKKTTEQLNKTVDAYIKSYDLQHGSIYRTSQGKKYDQSKLRWDLLPIETIEEAVKVLTYGSNKYGDNNWQGVDSERYYAALMRHLVEWRKGNDIDSESGHKHLSHALTNIIFLLWKDMNKDK